MDAKALAKQSEALSKKISSQRQAIDKDKFPEAEKLLAQIEKKADDLAKAPPGQKDKLLVEMNKLTDALKDRQETARLCPTRSIASSSNSRTWARAARPTSFPRNSPRATSRRPPSSSRNCMQKLEKGQMTQAEKKALQEQLAEMAKKLQQAANMEERKKQLDQALKNGGLSKEQYEREMEKLKQQSKSLKQLEQLAGKLGKAQEALKKGDTKQAAESLGMTQQQLAQMAKQLEEMEALDSAMADVENAKNGMSEDGMNQLGQMMDGMGNMDMHSQGWAAAWVEAAARAIAPRLPTRPRPTAPRFSSKFAKARRCSRGSPSPARRSRATASSTSRARWKPPPPLPPTRSRTRRSPRTSRSTSGRITTKSTRGK